MTEKKEKILIVEDDENIRTILKAFIEKSDYTTIAAGDGVAGYEYFMKEVPDLIILDIMLPKMNGYDLLAKIRESSDIPVIMLTALGREQEQARGFDLEADDYIVKPFSYTLLLKRMEAVLRRSKIPEDTNDVLQHGQLLLQKSSYEIRYKGVLLAFTRKEYELIKFMLEHKNQVFTRAQLLDILWGEDYYGNEKIIDNHIKNIRKKLDDNSIQTVWGMGYKISG